MSSQFIYFISISTCDEFQICGEFYISYSNKITCFDFTAFCRNLAHISTWHKPEHGISIDTHGHLRLPGPFQKMNHNK